MPNYWDQLFDLPEEPDSIRIRDVPDGTRILVASDMQIPMFDKDLCRVIFEEFAHWFAPDPPAEYHLFLNGDVMDNYRLSKFTRRAMPKFTQEDELGLVRHLLWNWGLAFSHKHYVFGNHEERWDRYAWENAPEVATRVPTLAEVLQLDRLGYDWVPYRSHYDFEGFIITHGDTTTKHAATTMMDVYHRSGTSGHTNRPQSFTFADAASGEPHTWYVTGMLCRRDIGKIIKDWRRTQPWQQAFLIGEVRDGVLYVELVRVHHSRFWAAGRMFEVG